MHPFFEFSKYLLIETCLFFLSMIYSILILILMLIKFIKNGPSMFKNQTEEMPENLKGWNHGFVLGDIRIHYVEAGDKTKPLLLFIHGFPGFWYSWHHQLKHFQNDYHVVAIDLRGFGDSEKPEGVENYDFKFLINDLMMIISSSGHETATLISHGFGGFICWMFSHVYPDFIDKLIFINSPHPEVYVKEIFNNWNMFLKSWFVFFIQAQGLPEIFYSCNNFEQLMSFFKDNSTNQKNWILENEKSFKHSFSTSNDLTSQLNYFRAARRRFSLGSLQIKDKIRPMAFIIWSENNKFFDDKMAHSSMKYCDRATIEFVSNFGHWMNQTDPNTVNNLITEFLNKI